MNKSKGDINGGGVCRTKSGGAKISRKTSFSRMRTTSFTEAAEAAEAAEANGSELDGEYQRESDIYLPIGMSNEQMAELCKILSSIWEEPFLVDTLPFIEPVSRTDPEGIYVKGSSVTGVAWRLSKKQSTFGAESDWDFGIVSKEAVDATRRLNIILNEFRLLDTFLNAFPNASLSKGLRTQLDVIISRGVDEEHDAVQLHNSDAESKKRIFQKRRPSQEIVMNDGWKDFHLPSGYHHYLLCQYIESALHIKKGMEIHEINFVISECLQKLNFQKSVVEFPTTLTVKEEKAFRAKQSVKDAEMAKAFLKSEAGCRKQEIFESARASGGMDYDSDPEGSMLWYTWKTVLCNAEFGVGKSFSTDVTSSWEVALRKEKESYAGLICELMVTIVTKLEDFVHGAIVMDNVQIGSVIDKISRFQSALNYSSQEGLSLTDHFTKRLNLLKNILRSKYSDARISKIKEAVEKLKYKCRTQLDPDVACRDAKSIYDQAKIIDVMIKEFSDELASAKLKPEVEPDPEFENPMEKYENDVSSLGLIEKKLKNICLYTSFENCSSSMPSLLGWSKNQADKQKIIESSSFIELKKERLYYGLNEISDLELVEKLIKFIKRKITQGRFSPSIEPLTGDSHQAANALGEGESYLAARGVSLLPHHAGMFKPASANLADLCVVAEVVESVDLATFPSKENGLVDEERPTVMVNE